MHKLDYSHPQRPCPWGDYFLQILGVLVVILAFIVLLFQNGHWKHVLIKFGVLLFLGISGNIYGRQDSRSL